MVDNGVAFCAAVCCRCGLLWIRWRREDIATWRSRMNRMLWRETCLRGKRELQGVPGCTAFCALGRAANCEFVVPESFRQLALFPAPSAAQAVSLFMPTQFAPHAARGVPQPQMPPPAEPVALAVCASGLCSLRCHFLRSLRI